MHAAAAKKKLDASRPNATVRGYGLAWRKKRDAYLCQHPWCESGTHAENIPATDVDHKVSKRIGGSDDASNLEALCHECHSRKTALEDGRWGHHG
jgi:5-methylcytosine-specific restriction protein A